MVKPVRAAIASGFERSNNHLSPRVALDSSVQTSTISTQRGHNKRVGRITALPKGFDCNSYTPIRLYSLASEDKEMLSKLVDLNTGHDEILCILELEDESFELGVLTTYIPELKELLNETFLSYLVDWEYRPFDLSLKDVESFCARHPELFGNRTEAKALMKAQFLKRAKEMIENGWPRQKLWYSHLLKLIPE